MSDVDTATEADDDRRPWSIADELLQKIIRMQEFARVISLASITLGRDEGEALSSVAWEIVETAEQARELNDSLLDKLATDNPDFPSDDGNGEVEDADGEAKAAS